MVFALIAWLLCQAPATGATPGVEAREQPAYRKVQPGERRSEGLLRRIVCADRGGVTFVVKQKDTEQKDTVVQYTAPQLSSVDFIVYRKDFRGPVTCEGFGAGIPVFVTWKPEGKTQRAVAIEFVPK